MRFLELPIDRFELRDAHSKEVCIDPADNEPLIFDATDRGSAEEWLTRMSGAEIVAVLSS